MEKWMAVLDFSGVYRQVRFWEEQENTAYLDLTRQQGTNCYCDDEAAEQIRQKLAGLGPEGIHFLDSGNYHYVTKLWTDLIREPFDLLVLDHHTDMQEPAFGGILSCGGWLRTILNENPHLGKVYLAGPPRKAAMEDGVSDFGERVFFTDEEGMRRASWKELLGGPGARRPLYISLDKDILRAGEAAVNWDQGEASLEDVFEVLKAAFALRPVIGVDLCGENPERMEDEKEFEKANGLNRLFLEAILAWQEKKCENL